MQKVRLIDLKEGSKFFKNENDSKPCTLLFFDLKSGGGGHVAYFHPKKGKKISRFYNLQSVFVEPIERAIWREVKEKHKTWENVAIALNTNTTTIREWREKDFFPPNFYQKYGFEVLKKEWKKNTAM